MYPYEALAKTTLPAGSQLELKSRRLFANVLLDSRENFAKSLLVPTRPVRMMEHVLFQMELTVVTVQTDFRAITAN